MPCSDGGVPYERERDDRDAQKKRLKERLDEVTRYLCYLCGHMEYKGFAVEFPKEIQEWWKEHQAVDTKRVSDKMHSYVTNKYKGETFFAEKDVASVANYFIHEAQKVHPVSKFHTNWFFDMALKTLKLVIDNNLKRRTVQQKKADALKKLTDEEKSLLGLK